MLELNVDLGKTLRQRRRLVPLSLSELSAKSGVSASHLGRIERGNRFPSARVLRKITEPLGMDGNELFALAGYLPQFAKGAERIEPMAGLDPYVASVLAQEPVGVQRSLVLIVLLLKTVAKGYYTGIAEYIRENYPQVDGDMIIMIEDILERSRKLTNNHA